MKAPEAPAPRWGDSGGPLTRRRTARQGGVTLWRPLGRPLLPGVPLPDPTLGPVPDCRDLTSERRLYGVRLPRSVYVYDCRTAWGGAGFDPPVAWAHARGLPPGRTLTLWAVSKALACLGVERPLGREYPGAWDVHTAMSARVPWGQASEASCAAALVRARKALARLHQDPTWCPLALVLTNAGWSLAAADVTVPRFSFE